MKRFLILSVVLVVFLAGAAVIAPGFIDWNKYKPQILEQLHNATGHNYKIDGPLEMAVLPFPHISIGGLTVATPTTSGDLPIMKLNNASAQLALTPLFSGDVVVSKVVLQAPVFELAIDQNGARSWMTPVLQAKTGQKKEGGGADSFGNAVALNEISIKDGKFSFSDYRSGQKIVLEGINLQLQGDSLYGPYSLDGDFVYEGTKTHIKLNSGRLDNLAESIALKFDVAFPDMQSTVTYAGVVAFKDTVELQGETGVQTPDLAALMAVANKKSAPPAYLKQSFSSKGIMSISKDEIAYRNLIVGFAGLEGTGSAVIRNFSKDAKLPLDAVIALDTTKSYDLQKLLPPPQQGGDKKAPAKQKTFLPETLTLPKEVTGSFNIKSAAVQYGGTNFSDVAFSIDRKDKGFNTQLSLKGPGNTAVDMNGTLDFAAQSKSGQSGSITFSDPTLSLQTKIMSDEPVGFAQAFAKAPLSPSAVALLSHKLASEAQLAITPKQIGINNGYVMLAETRINATGKYIAGAAGGRDMLAVELGNLGLDVDQWAKSLAPPPAPATTPQEQKADTLAAVKNIGLPFDADFSATVQSLHFKGRDYSNFAAKGKLVKSQLSFETLQLTSNAGDVFTVAGGVKNISTLNGIDLSLQANIVDMEQTLKSFGADKVQVPPGVGKGEVLAEVKGEPDKLGFTVNVKAMRAMLQASGEVTSALTKPVVSDLTLRLQHPSYVEVARIYNPDFNSGVGIKKNLDVFASMNRKDNIYTFSQLQAVIGPATIKGDVVADVSGAKPAITAALEFTDLPLDDLMGIRSSKGSGSIASQPLNNRAGQQDVRWSRNAIDTALLHKADIALKATANSITYGNWHFRDAGINIDLKGGNLEIKQLDAGLYGGHIAITGNLKTSNKERQPLSFAGDILAQDVSLEEFVKSFSGSQLIKAQGTVSVDTTLQTTGLSPAALVFDLKGKGTAKGEKLVFEGFDLARLSRSLAAPSSSFTQNFSGLLDATLKGGVTSFDELDGAFTITEGVINFDKMNLLGPDANVATTGTVSLPLWTMDLTSTIQLAEPKDAPPLRASFKGPIDQPAQTFGQNAMQQYFQKQLEGVVLDPLLNKIDKSGALKGLLNGVPPTQPAPQQPVQPQAVPQNQSQQVPPQPQQQQAQPQQQPKEMKPEDAFMGILQQVIQDH